MNSRIILTGLAVIVTAMAVTGCATTQTDDPYANTKRGAAIGAAVGAAAGVFVGDGELDEILGTAAVGAGLGAGVGLYMDKQQKALEEIEEVEVERVDEETLRINFDSDILFAVDSAILSGEAKYSLDQFAQVMRDYPQTAILIQGHTDSSGSEEHNMKQETFLPDDYRPAEDEPFMNERQLEYFRRKLLAFVRRIRLEILTLGRDFATVNLEFELRGTDRVGRQSQTWVRFPDVGWKVVSAHVSTAAARPDG